MLAFAAIAIVTLSSPGTAATDRDEQAKLDALKSKISDLQKQLRHTDDKHNKLTSQLRETEIKSAKTRTYLQKLNEQITAINAELGQLAQRHKKLETKRKQQTKIVSRELDAAYRLGKQEQLKLLFNLESPDNLSRMLKYYEYMVNARKVILVDYKNTLNEISTIEVSLQEKQLGLQDSKAKAVEATTKLDQELLERKALLSKIDQQLSSGNNRLATLQLEQSQLEKIIVRLEESIQQLSIPNKTPFTKQKGKLPWPVKGQVRHKFGTTRNAHLKWSGWLINAGQSSTVKSLHYGRVVFSDYLRGQGLLLIIDHGEGYLSLYAHNQVLLKEAGDWVSSGETIAQVGNTGGLTESALYFEIRHKGKAVDPKRWLKPKA